MEIGAHVWLKSENSQWGWVPAYIANKEPLDDDGHLVRITLKDDPVADFVPAHNPPPRPYVGPGHLTSFDVGVHSPHRLSRDHRPDDHLSPDVSMALNPRHSSVWAGRGDISEQNEFKPFEITIDVDSEQLKRPEGLEDVKFRNIDTSQTNLSVQESENTCSNVDDLIHLTHLHEPAILHSLRIRYDQDIIYTNTGPILIAVNPFKPMTELYSMECMERYRMNGEGLRDANIPITPSGHSLVHNNSRRTVIASPTPPSASRNERLSPHVYQTTDDAYRAMVRGIETTLLMRQSSRRVVTDIPPCNQSILVSGESGAGKTVTTKIVLNYLAVLSKRSDQFTGYASSPSRRLLGASEHEKDDVVTIEQQVLQSNPILEAFGNARTIRNDNSSRFGKYIDVHFTSNGKLTGATIETYLLEKVRLIQPTFGERNYHVFYQLLASATKQEREQFFLENLQPPDFVILQSSDTYDRRDGVSDSENHLEMLDAMITIGFDALVIQNLMQLVVAVLFLGNLQFQQMRYSDHEDEGCVLLDSPDREAVSLLLGVDSRKLAQSLTHKIVVAGLESVIVPLSVAQALNAKEALIKAVYGAAFDFVVQQTNKSIRDEPSGLIITPSKGASKRHLTPAACIGVLDIFGFETFQVNTFEQICINYTNEALQQQFNKYVFKLEQQEYEREGIMWKFISFPDNQDVLDLIDKKHLGILALLDEQCIVPQSSDEKFTRYLYAKCDKHPRFSASSTQRVNHKFSVDHYAGPVEYSTDGWLEKNRDQLPDASVKLLSESTFPLIQDIRPFIRVEQKKSNSRGGAGVPMGGSISAKSVGAQFTDQLRLLRKRIDTTVPHYIRCLKPNDELIPHCFEPKNVVEQLRCGGVLEAVRVSRAGYPTRYPHEVFLRRYFVLGDGGINAPLQSAILVKPGSPRGVKPPTTQEALKHLIDTISNDIWEADLLLLRSLREAEKSVAGTPRATKSIDGSLYSPGKQRTIVSTYKNKTDKPRTPSRISQISSQLRELEKGYEGVGAFPESRDAFESLNFSSRCAIAGLQLGRTKVFLRREAFDRIEKMRSDRLSGAASAIQSLIRGIQTRYLYKKMRDACIKVQSIARVVCAIKLRKRISFEKRAVYIIQRAYRNHRFYEIQKTLSFNTKKKREKATLDLQRALRGKSARSFLSSLKEQKNVEEDGKEELAAVAAAKAKAEKAKADKARAEKAKAEKANAEKANAEKANAEKAKAEKAKAEISSKSVVKDTRENRTKNLVEQSTFRRQQLQKMVTTKEKEPPAPQVQPPPQVYEPFSQQPRQYNPELVTRKNELYRLIEERDWASVEKMLDKYPELAGEEEPSTGELALHVIARHGDAWSLLVDMMLLLNPKALLHRDRMGALPIHHAAAHNSLAALEIIYTAYKEGVNQVDFRGRLPLHVASEFDALEAVKFLLERAPDGAYTMVHRPPSSSGGGLPLHVACRNFASIGVITALLAENFASGKRSDENGDLPLHLILRCGEDVDQVSVKTLLTCFSAAISRTDMNGDLPLAIALKNGCNPAVVNYLLLQYPNAATILDGESHSPLYLALANDADDRVVLSLLNHAPYLAVAKDDPTGLIPIQVAMENGHSHNIVYNLLKRDLPIDLKEKVQPQMMKHNYSWNFLLSESHDEYFQVVSKLLQQCTQPQVLALAHVEGPDGKIALASATPVCKHELRIMLRLFNSLEVVNQRPAYSNPNSDTQIFYALRYEPPQHQSDTNFTIIHDETRSSRERDFVEDIDDDDNSLASGVTTRSERTTVPVLTQKSHSAASITVEERLYQIRKEKGQQVIAKLTSRSEVVERELRVRKQFKLSRNYVPAIMSVHHTVQHAAYSEAMAEPGYCITMEGADTTAENMILDYRKANKSFPIKALKRIGIALLHMHEHGLVHGDFGTHNIGKFKNRWKLLGVGGSIPLGEYTDPSRGFYHPPEAVDFDRTLGMASRSRHSGASVISIRADPTYDIWAYGVVLYEAIAGFPLSVYARRGQDEASGGGADLYKIAKWDEGALDKALRSLTRESAVAYDLLARTLHPHPRLRLHSMREALQHPFFNEVSEDRSRSASRGRISSASNHGGTVDGRSHITSRSHSSHYVAAQGTYAIDASTEPNAKSRMGSKSVSSPTITSRAGHGFIARSGSRDSVSPSRSYSDLHRPSPYLDDALCRNNSNAENVLNGRLSAIYTGERSIEEARPSDSVRESATKKKGLGGAIRNSLMPKKKKHGREQLLGPSSKR